MGALSRLNDPDLSIGTDQLTAGNLKYTFAEAAMLVLPPEKKLEVPDPELNSKCQEMILKSCVGMAQVLSLPELIVEGDGTTISLVAIDTSLPSSDKFPVKVGTTDKEFKMVFKIETMKMMSGDYRCEQFLSKGISWFAHKTANSKLEYWIATEAEFKLRRLIWEIKNNFYGLKNIAQRKWRIVFFRY